jgi:AcrR family transcriptional regulator
MVTNYVRSYGGFMGKAAEPVRAPGRPAVLSRERIVEAVAASANVDQLTMRQLAARLDVSHGALYRWVRSRDELFDLISAVLVDRIVEIDVGAGTEWRATLSAIAWAMHDEFGRLPGYATHLSRPHEHNHHSLDRLRLAVTEALENGGVAADLAEQGWYIFVTSVIGWLAREENPLDLGPAARRVDLFLDVLLRGLPPQEPGRPRPAAGSR